MKVLLVNKFHYMRGGSETYYFGLAQLLREQGHQVACFAMQDERNLPCEQSEYFVSNVDYNGAGGSKLKMATTMLYSTEARDKFEKLILQEKPDVVHIGLVHRQITLSILEVTKKYHIPVVFIIHDLIWLCPCYTMLSGGQVCRKCMHGSYGACIRQKCVKGSAAKSLLAVAEAKFIRHKKYADDIDLYIAQCDKYKRLMEEGQVTHSPIVHMVNFLPADKQYETHRLKPGAEPYFLYFGRFSHEKGILTLIDAYLSTQVKEPLWIVGAGPQKEEIEEYLRRKDTAARIRLVGPTYGAQMEEILRGCKAVAVPSEWDENCPYALMEAMAKGVPILASRMGGLPEMIEDGKTGFLFAGGSREELAQSLQKLSALSEEKYVRMCDATVESARRQFDREAYGKNLTALYKKLIDEKGAPQYG